MKKEFIVLILISLISLQIQAQDIKYVERIVKKLSAKKYWGRGYTKEGMLLASLYLEKEYKSLKLQPLFDDNYRQAFTFPVNTFPGTALLKINGVKLKAGRDYILKANSIAGHKDGVLNRIDSVTWADKVSGIKYSQIPKLTWSVAKEATNETLIQALMGKVLPDKFAYKMQIDQQLVSDFQAYNVGGWIKGTQYPDQYLVITAHYDHLGGFGKGIFFPGANDNASGVAFMLSLAKYYQQNPPAFSVVFLAFAAEEAGLLGSKYYTENPAFDLKQIKFLFNFDLMGNGDQGVTIVNGSIFTKQFELLKGINEKGKFLSAVNSRGRAANSDHFYFSEKGVPAFFMYTQGGGSAYHDVKDVAKDIKFPVYNKLFELIRQFNTAVMN